MSFDGAQPSKAQRSTAKQSAAQRSASQQIQLSGGEVRWK